MPVWLQMLLKDLCVFIICYASLASSCIFCYLKLVITNNNFSGNDEGQLDFFTVRLTGSTGKVLCSVYPGTANLDDKSRGMRVNCANRHKMYSKVIIYSHKNIGFVITEIEVHSLGVFFQLRFFFILISNFFSLIFNFRKT